MNLDFELERLETAGLVRPLDVTGHDYSFKHILVQETSYASLLKAERRRLHREVAETLERVFADRLDDFADILGYHWEQAQDPERARRYLFRAGQLAAARYAHAEAVDLFTRALEQPGIEPRTREELLEARATSFQVLNEPERALEDHLAALELATARHDWQRVGRIQVAVAGIHWVRGRPAETQRIADQLQNKSQELHDPNLAAVSRGILALVAQDEGRLLDAHAETRSVLKTFRAQGNAEMEAVALQLLTMQNNFMGRFGRAVACAELTHGKYAQLGDISSDALTLAYKSLAEAARGDYDAALATLEAAHRMAERVNDLFLLARYWNQRGWLASELGDYAAAYEFDGIGLERARELAAGQQPEISVLINLVLDSTGMGDLEQAEQWATECEALLVKPGYGFHLWRWHTRLADARAGLALARGDLDGAEQHLEQLFQWTGRTQARKYAARGLLLRAQLHEARGENEAALQAFAAAAAAGDALCYYPVRLQARAGWTRLQAHVESAAAAAQRRQETLALCGELDRSLRTSELHRSFERGLMAHILAELPAA